MKGNLPWMVFVLVGGLISRPQCVCPALLWSSMVGIHMLQNEAKYATYKCEGDMFSVLQSFRNAYPTGRSLHLAHLAQCSVQVYMTNIPLCGNVEAVWKLIIMHHTPYQKHRSIVALLLYTLSHTHTLQKHVHTVSLLCWNSQTLEVALQTNV